MRVSLTPSAGFNVFFSGGPILLIQVMSVAAELFGWFTLAWAGNFVLGSLVSSRLQGRVKSLLLIPVGQGILTLGAVAMMATAALGYVTPLALIVPTFVCPPAIPLTNTLTAVFALPVRFEMK